MNWKVILWIGILFIITSFVFRVLFTNFETTSTSFLLLVIGCILLAIGVIKEPEVPKVKDNL